VHLTGVAIGAVVAIGSAPVLTGLISRLTGGGRLTGRWLAATAGAIAGCTVLVTGGSAAGVNLPGVGLALTAGLCYAAYAVTAARLISAGTGERAVMAALLALIVLGERLTPAAAAGVALAGLALAVLLVPGPGAGRRAPHESGRPRPS
jgi:DME family drug/metabolite transporter